MTASCSPLQVFFFFNDTATTEIYTLSLHDALPISLRIGVARATRSGTVSGGISATKRSMAARSEEHTSELQSQSNLVCRLLLEKKKNDAQNLIVSYSSVIRHLTCSERNALLCHLPY